MTTMKAFFENHPDVVLAICACAIMVAVIACAMWSVGNLTQNTENAFSSGGAVAPVSSFNLQAAAGLDLHGLTPNTSQ